MFGTQDLSFFLLAAISLNLIPGADTIYIVTRSIAQGKKAGTVSALGIGSGSLFHASAAAFGLSAIILSSTIAFALIKWIGALYLIYLGMQMFFQKNSAKYCENKKINTNNMWQVYRQAILTNVLNPKVALFFMALLPQFVSPQSQYKIFSFLFLGIIFVCTGTLWCLFIAFFASSMSKKLTCKNKFSKISKSIAGTIFIALGIKLATQKFR